MIQLSVLTQREDIDLKFEVGSAWRAVMPTHTWSCVLLDHVTKLSFNRPQCSLTCSSSPGLCVSYSQIYLCIWCLEICEIHVFVIKYVSKVDASKWAVNTLSSKWNDRKNSF